MQNGGKKKSFTKEEPNEHRNEEGNENTYRMRENKMNSNATLIKWCFSIPIIVEETASKLLQHCYKKSTR